MNQPPKRERGREAKPTKYPNKARPVTARSIRSFHFSMVANQGGYRKTTGSLPQDYQQLCEFFNEAIHWSSVQLEIVVHMQMSQHSPHRSRPSMPRLHKRHPLCRSLPSGPPKAGSVLTSTKLRAYAFACQSRAPVTLHTLERHHQSACASC